MVVAPIYRVLIVEWKRCVNGYHFGCVVGRSVRDLCGQTNVFGFCAFRCWMIEQMNFFTSVFANEGTVTCLFICIYTIPYGLKIRVEPFMLNCYFGMRKHA